MINIAELEQAMSKMTPRSKLFKAIKAELQARGHWKNKNRGVNNFGRQL